MCKELAVLKMHNCNVVWCKMQNIMSECFVQMPNYHAQNKTSCCNATSCSKHRRYA